jgi:hypothetical protein
MIGTDFDARQPPKEPYDQEILMNITASRPTSNMLEAANSAQAKTAPWFLLFGRTGLFLTIQALFALGFYLAGSTTAWNAGAAWWPFVVTIANLICLTAMGSLVRKEGSSYWSIFRIQREHIKGDLLALLGTMLVVGPIAYFPNPLLASWLFGDPRSVLDLMVLPLPMWAAVASIVLFPITQGLVELPLYFSYVMPRLSARRFPDLRPVILPAIMLGVQHFAVPFAFDLRFITWRALMFIPFAFAAGIILHWRPRLLPYMVIIHVLMDMSFAMMLLGAAY